MLTMFSVATTARPSFDARALSSQGEPVVVTPCVTRPKTGSTAMDDIAFASHGVFAWRTEIVTKASASGKLSFRTHTPTATFAREALHHVPRVGDRLTRSWDGVVFEILDVGARGRDVVCGLAEVFARQAH